MGFVILIIILYVGKVLYDIEGMKHEIKLLRNAVFELQKQKEKEQE